MRRNVEAMKKHLCTGCGFCAAVCPNRCITMYESKNGLVRPSVKSDACVNCAKCLGVCGGRGLHDEAFKDGNDPIAEPPLKGFLSQSRDTALLKNGQSGGAVTTILSTLLKQKIIDAALVAIMPQDGSFRPRGVLVTTPEELNASQGSIYVQVPFDEALREMADIDGRVALVGLPCHLHSLFNARHRLGATWAGKVVLKIGLACNSVFSRAVYDFLLNSRGLSRNDCLAFRFREKKHGGWPGTGNVLLHDGSERKCRDIWRQDDREKFVPLRCRLCFDKMNFLADIVATDPWGLRNDSVGWTVLLARTITGLKVLEVPEVRQAISLETIDFHAVYRNLYVEDRRTQWSYFRKRAKDAGMAIPRHAVDERWISPEDRQSSCGKRQEMRFRRSLELEEANARQDTIDFPLENPKSQNEEEQV